MALLHRAIIVSSQTLQRTCKIGKDCIYAIMTIISTNTGSHRWMLNMSRYILLNIILIFFDSSSLCISTAGAGIKHTESIILSALFLWLLHSFLLIPSVVHTKCIMKQHDNYNDYGRKGGLFSFTIHIRYIPHSFEIENYRAPPPPWMFMLFLHSVKSCFLNGNKLA